MGIICGGGLLVYSTCTFAPEENEQRIAAFLRDRHPWLSVTGGIDSRLLIAALGADVYTMGGTSVGSMLIERMKVAGAKRAHPADRGNPRRARGAGSRHCDPPGRSSASRR